MSYIVLIASARGQTSGHLKTRVKEHLPKSAVNFMKEKTSIKTKTDTNAAKITFN